MTDREKLIALLEKHEYQKHYPSTLAAILLANGVTFATDNNVGGKWIPVTERLPEQYESVIVWTMYGEMGEAEHDGKRFIWAYDNDVAAATHWMPFPEPPKEGE